MSSFQHTYPVNSNDSTSRRACAVSSAGLAFLADVDCYETYPLHGKQLARVSVPAARRPSPPPKRRGDYTVHGGHVSTCRGLNIDGRDSLHIG
jgi:hypothetical protein